jgi:hypothetical protein
MDDPQQETDQPGEDSRERSRLQLILDVAVFQFKLAADGLRDLVLVPLSLISGVMGLFAGGEDPYRYYRQVLRFGRRSEIWINLFGHRSHRGTSDELIAPIKDRVMTEAERNPWISKAGEGLNRRLDSMEEKIRASGSRGKDENR